jgi:hypothetical protein
MRRLRLPPVVYVDEKWAEKTNKASQMEEDMLDFASTGPIAPPDHVRPDWTVITTPTGRARFPDA